MAKKSQNLAAQMGQLLVVGFDGTDMTPGARRPAHSLQPAGIILFARNINSASQTYNLLKDCQSCVSTAMFHCVDMEGGRVDRLKNVIAPRSFGG